MNALCEVEVVHHESLEEVQRGERERGGDDIAETCAELQFHWISSRFVEESDEIKLIAQLSKFQTCLSKKNDI